MILNIDTVADALYISLSDHHVTKTLELNPDISDIYVDVDDMNHVVGIEVLNYAPHKQLEIPSFAVPTRSRDVKAFAAQFA
jgi:uncharacterized protein YuzE